MMLMTQYTYTVDASPRGGVDVTLTNNTDPLKKKVWYVAMGTVEGLGAHMRSLTDELCDGFFPKPREKKPKKVVDESNG